MINIDNFSFEFWWGLLGIEPGAAGSRSKYANNCAILPLLYNYFSTGMILVNPTWPVADVFNLVVCPAAKYF